MKTILIIEDQAGPMESLRMVLRAFYNLEVARDGTTALEIIASQKVDLVTLDLKLPDFSGKVILKTIKKIAPHIEIIIVSGSANSKNAINGIRYGAHDFIVKPFDITDLLNTISKALSKNDKRIEPKGVLNEDWQNFWNEYSKPVNL